MNIPLQIFREATTHADSAKVMEGEAAAPNI